MSEPCWKWILLSHSINPSWYLNSRDKTLLPSPAHTIHLWTNVLSPSFGVVCYPAIDTGSLPNHKLIFSSWKPEHTNPTASQLHGSHLPLVWFKKAMDIRNRQTNKYTQPGTWKLFTASLLGCTHSTEPLTHLWKGKVTFPFGSTFIFVSVTTLKKVNHFQRKTF